MSQTTKTILIIFITTIIAGGGVYLWQTNKSSQLPPAPPSSREWDDLIKYNCELSDGAFINGTCKCPIEENLGQTQEKMYDKSKGYCQTTAGGPGGNAFEASLGLPWGNYSFWTEIVGNNCTETGGSWHEARCTCSAGKTYNSDTGYCK